jgi:hypothetical protein
MVMGQVLGSVVLGLACFGIVAALMAGNASEGEIWGAWLVTTAAAAALVGHCWPARALRGALLIMLTQPPCVLVSVAVAGEITNPGRSTGGLVAVAICSGMLFLWTPVPLVVAWFAARARRRAHAVVAVVPRPPTARSTKPMHPTPKHLVRWRLALGLVPLVGASVWYVTDGWIASAAAAACIVGSVLFWMVLMTRPHPLMTEWDAGDDAGDDAANVHHWDGGDSPP